MCSLDVGSNKEQMDQNIIACAQIVEKGDPVRFRAIMALPAQYRPSLFVIFAFNLDVRIVKFTHAYFILLFFRQF